MVLVGGEVAGVGVMWAERVVGFVLLLGGSTAEYVSERGWFSSFLGVGGGRCDGVGVVRVRCGGVIRKYR